MSARVVLLACGSFNPPTNAHLRMFERAREHFEKTFRWKVLEGIISPVNDAYKKPGLIPGYHRMKMLNLALESSSWIRADGWECSLEEWCRTLLVLRHFRSELLKKYSKHIANNNNEEESLQKKFRPTLQHKQEIKLMILCGSDFLESFAVPSLWVKEDIEEIVRDFGLVVIYREGTNPYKFVYDHEVLYKHQSNIHIVHEWIINDISSTKVRVALSRGESVRYLIPDKVLTYIEENELYIDKSNNNNDGNADSMCAEKRDGLNDILNKNADGDRIFDKNLHNPTLKSTL